MTRFELLAQMKGAMLMRVRSTTESPSSFIPFPEAGSTGEGLEGRSNETLALSLTSVGCAGPATSAAGA